MNARQLSNIRKMEGTTVNDSFSHPTQDLNRGPWANLNSTRATIQIGKAIIFIAAMLLAAVVALWAADVLAKTAAEVNFIIVRSL